MDNYMVLSDICKNLAENYRIKYKEGVDIPSDIIMYLQIIYSGITLHSEDFNRLVNLIHNYLSIEDFYDVDQYLKVKNRTNKSVDNDYEYKFIKECYMSLQKVVTKIELYGVLISKGSLYSYVTTHNNLATIFRYDEGDTVGYLSCKYFKDFCKGTEDFEFLTILSNIMFLYSTDLKSNYSNYLTNAEDIKEMFVKYIPMEYYDDEFISRVVNNGSTKSSEYQDNKVFDFENKDSVYESLRFCNGVITDLRCYKNCSAISSTLLKILKYTLSSNKKASKFIRNILLKYYYLNPSLSTNLRSYIESILKHYDAGELPKYNIIKLTKSNSF